jgi:lipoprotein-anchoring transpeptidase ErfK/SrfK
MRKILVILLIFNISLSYASINSLLEKASITAEEKQLNDYFNIAFDSYNEGLYNITEKACLNFLKNAPADDENFSKILELLANTYYRTKNKWAMEHYVVKYLFKYRKYIDDDTAKKVFVLINNLFIDDKSKRNYFKHKFKYIWDFKEKPLDLPPELKDFTPYVNIFPFENSRLFGVNKIYFSDKDQTLYEVGYEVDMGFDELKEANPLLNPFDIRKGTAIFLPRKRLIPAVNYKPNEIYINLEEKRLYYIYEKNNKSFVITFPIGIGTDDAKSPVGTFEISQKRVNPAWYVPKNIKEENPDLPDVVPPGPNNPLGIRAMRLSNSTYLIHGTNKNFGVGLKVSHGCIRLFNRDVERLFNIVDIGTKVIIFDKKIKASYTGNNKYVEIHSKKKELKSLNLNIYAKKINESYLNYIKKERRGFAFPLY